MKKIYLFTLLISLIIQAPQAQPLNPVLANNLQSILDGFRIENNLKGISAHIIYPGEGTWYGVSGISHPGNPITPNMLFGIASNTKLFTAVLILKLAENHSINLDDSLHQYLPNFVNIDSNITIRQLLNHTTGLADVTSIPGYSDSMLLNPNRIFTAAEMLTWASTPLFQPGNGWNYCNTNYLIAGMIAESASGQSFHQLLRNLILNPLQLDSTFLAVYETLNLPIAHPWQAGINNNAIPRTSVNSAAWSAGAMYATSGEMAQWYNALMNGQILNPNSFNQMTTFVGSGNYGTGISEVTLNDRTVWTHGGTIWGGYNSSMIYDTTSGIVICILINQLPAQAFQLAIQLLNSLTQNPVSTPQITTNENKMAIYPNPTNNIITINLPPQTIQQIKLYNPFGTLLKEFKTTQISIADLPNGTYFLSIQTPSNLYQYPIIKQ
jgi:D-alanyl-D-alanine carboxypeptidase